MVLRGVALLAAAATSIRPGKEVNSMNLPTDQPRSPAVKASWGSLGLALGCLCVLFLFQLADQMTPFAREARGVLTGFLPRALLYLLWAGEATIFLWLVVGHTVIGF